MIGLSVCGGGVDSVKITKIVYGEKQIAVHAHDHVAMM
jgi:hypothetical protein